MKYVYSVRLHPSRGQFIKILVRELGEIYLDNHLYLHAICNDKTGWMNTISIDDQTMNAKVFATETEAMDDLMIQLHNEGYHLLTEERIRNLGLKIEKISHLK